MPDQSMGKKGNNNILKSFSLLESKFFIQPIKSDFVSRPRLLEKLKESTDKKLTIISAPPGFGKTSLISDFVKRSRKKTAYYLIEKEDNDPYIFLNYFISAIQKIDSKLGRKALGMLNSPHSMHRDMIVVNLLNDLVRHKSHFNIVMDDYHLIDNKQINKFVSHVIDHMPLQMHLIIITRSDPVFALGRLRSNNQLLEIRSADLSFSSDEISELYNSKMKIGINDGEINALADKTEGWVAGLLLAANSLAGHTDKTGFIAKFTGDNRYIADYLVEEVLSRQNDEVKNFLLKTSILNKFSAGLCDYVLQIKNSQQIIDSLEKENLFLFAIDDKREWFRYHRLFADLLASKANMIDKGVVNKLHKRACEWFADNKIFNEAIDHALITGDTDCALRIIEQERETLLLRGEIVLYHKWIESLPEKVQAQNPVLQVYHAGLELFKGEPLEDVEALLKEAEQNADGKIITGEISAFRAVISAYKNDNNLVKKHSAVALKLLPEDSYFLRTAMAAISGLYYLYNGEIDEGIKAFNESVNLSKKTGNKMMAVLSSSHIAELESIRGNFNKAMLIYDETVRIGSDEDGNIQPACGLVNIGLAFIYRLKHDLLSAKREIEKGIDLINQWTDIGTIKALLELAYLNDKFGYPGKADKLLSEARIIAERFNAMEIDDHMVGVYENMIRLKRNNVNPVIKWAEERNLNHKETTAIVEDINKSIAKYIRIAEYIVCCNLCMALKEYDKVIMYYKTLYSVVEKADWHNFKIELKLILSSVLFMKGEDEPAMEALITALSLAEEEQIVSPFIDAGLPVEKQLRLLTKNQLQNDSNISSTFIEKILNIISETEKCKPAASADREMLSSRELEVLQLIAEGLTNEQIADKLFISLNTVRSHTKKINSKLSVHSRIQAVAKAQEISII